MKKNISLLITLFIASTLLIAAKPLTEKTKPINKVKAVDKVRPTKDEVAARKIVKPMRKKPGKSLEIQNQLQLLKEKFEAEKLLIDNQYKSDLRMHKKRKKEETDELRAEYRKKRALLRNK